MKSHDDSPQQRADEGRPEPQPSPTLSDRVVLADSRPRPVADMARLLLGLIAKVRAGRTCTAFEAVIAAQFELEATIAVLLEKLHARGELDREAAYAALAGDGDQAEAGDDADRQLDSAMTQAEKALGTAASENTDTASDSGGLDEGGPDAPDAHPESALMIEVQKRLRTIFSFPEYEDPFMCLLLCWRRFTAQPACLTWESHGDLHSWWRNFGLKIESGPSSKMSLRFRWPRGGSRIVGHGDRGYLEGLAARICERGGPHGGPESRARQRPLLTNFERLDTHERPLVEGFGAGFEARLRPLGTDLDGDHALIIVSPTGSFVLVDFGAHYNMAVLAELARRKLVNEFDDDLHDKDKPFHVRIRGVPHRLEHVRMHALAGYALTPLGEVYLVLLGYDDVALILVADEVPQCLFRGAARDANGLELLQDFLAQPQPFTRERVATLIGVQPDLHPVMRRHLVELVLAARDEIGTENARHLIWALVAAHARGMRTGVGGTPGEVFRWVWEQGHLQSMPKDRSARGALSWLAARSPLFERSVEHRVARWRCHIEWLSHPSEACLARCSAVPGPQGKPGSEAQTRRIGRGHLLALGASNTTIARWMREGALRRTADNCFYDITLEAFETLCNGKSPVNSTPKPRSRSSASSGRTM